MPHLRKRHLSPEIQRQGKFWPVVGLLGLRQSGKSTLLREILGIGRYTTLDDEDSLEDVKLSAKNFLNKLGTPSVIDEAQKAPALFDAVKLFVDRNRRPGMYYLTGSSQFSAKLGIRESLTGRIGISRIYPFTLAEAHGLSLLDHQADPWVHPKVRFSVEDAMKRLSIGGLPVPLFTRDTEPRSRYFEGWLETAILRDAARVFGKNYDPDVANSILRQMGKILREGELPTLTHFKQSSRILRRYLDAFENIFLLHKLPCHESGTGKEAWMMSDGGLARELMGTDLGEGASLSLCRIFLLNELLASCEALGKRLRPLYYKSARGSPVDLVWQDTLIKVSILPRSQLKYDERPLLGAMKTLGCKKGILVVPRDEFVNESSGREKSQNVRVVSLTHWS